jgi:GDPmannose 4,6-dehydratase
MSFEYPVETFDSILIGTMNLLECIRLLKNPVKFYNAGSSEVFGNTNGPANEETPFRPRSPYATAKAASHYAVANYREAYGLFTCTGILFNHESPLRPTRFVTSKIVSTAVRIANGSEEKLVLGNIDVCRDWGWAPDYVEAMWLILQQEVPEDFVVATGETHVQTSPSFHRPSDIAFNCGDASKAHRLLGWVARNKFHDVIRLLVESSQKRAANSFPSDS